MTLIQKQIDNDTELLADIRKLNNNSGFWIAGGAARRAAQGLEIEDGDFDIFFSSISWGSMLRTVHKSFGYPTQILGADSTWIKETHFNYFDLPAWAHNAQQCKDFNLITTIKGKANKVFSFEVGTKKIHFVHDEKFTTCRSILESFDFTICQFITDGYSMIGTEQAFDDLSAARLRITEGRKSRPNSRSRVLKYLSHGFHPIPGVLEWAFCNPKICVDEDFVVSYV